MPKRKYTHMYMATAWKDEKHNQPFPLCFEEKEDRDAWVELTSKSEEILYVEAEDVPWAEMEEVSD